MSTCLRRMLNAATDINVAVDYGAISHGRVVVEVRRPIEQPQAHLVRGHDVSFQPPREKEALVEKLFHERNRIRL